MTAKLFQIFYDSESESRLLPEFTPYDNTHRGNDGWHEYSVIREVLSDSSQIFSDEDYVGFFSPRFSEKVSMTGKEVGQVVSSSSSDVISFSPNFWQIAIFQNSFYQGDKHHPGLLECAQQVCQELNLSLDLSALWQDRHRIIFSNYFVAKYRIWKQWLELSEAVYAMAQNPASPLFNALNKPVLHRNLDNKYRMVVFILERLISVLLERDSIDAQVAIKFSRDDAGLANFLILDAIKSAVIKSDLAEHSELFFHYRKHLFPNQQF